MNKISIMFVVSSYLIVLSDRDPNLDSVNSYIILLLEAVLYIIDGSSIEKRVCVVLKSIRSR